ncbi:MULTISPECIES: COG4315 family predicted lipoprotein [Pseudomonas]|uniref:Lipoprotein n=2 Tax=Pseudomonas TaxID=286 RepID=A0A0G3G6J0_9PSED|nr:MULTISPECIES: hypothetical protein [Pseudomonas]AKJ96865.1 hypothetical protein VM99_01920 [Pseudomonas chlororaphis]ROM82077.1 hypothetical protein BK652_16385 [Pseudomonas brassicacearum]BBP67853.1 hypothetical protein PHLH5_53940 [Pseudomonas sp. Cab53]
MTPMTVSFKALLLAAAVALPGLAMAADPAMEKDGMFTDHKGMTLYTYDKDADGKSNCNGQCAENWPPLMAGSDAKTMGKWTVVKRDDGSMQWAYDDDPLYTYKGDEKAGDKAGEGKGGVWHIAKPD